MISDSKLRYAISNLGWVDKGGLWIYDRLKGNYETINLSDSKYLNIFEGLNDYFAICHNYEKNVFDISIHHFDNPRHILCKLTFDNLKTKVEGDITLIKYIPQYFILGLSLNNDFRFHLASIQDGVITLDDSKIDWYYNGNFDFGYQGLIGVTEYNDELLFCVQRDGSLYRVSKETNQMISKIELAKRYGNPRLTFNKDKTGIFIDDYDTLLKINPKTWKVEKSKILQTADKGTQQFIGSFSLNKHSDLITVARPFSSDVIMIDKNFDVKYACNIGKQPLEAVVFDDNKVIARDWQTGNLLTGKIEKNSLPNTWYKKLGFK